MLARLALFALLAIGLPAAHAQKLVTFGHGTTTVLLPPGFITTELNDGTLRAVFGKTGENRLEIAIREAASTTGDANAGEQFVRAEAKAKGLHVFEYPGRVAFMQAAPDTRDGDRTLRTALWEVGFGDSVAVLTLVAPAEPTPELSQFLGAPLNTVVTSVRRKAPAPAPAGRP